MECPLVVVGVIDVFEGGKVRVDFAKLLAKLLDRASDFECVEFLE